MSKKNSPLGSEPGRRYTRGAGRSPTSRSPSLASSLKRNQVDSMSPSATVDKHFTLRSNRSIPRSQTVPLTVTLVVGRRLYINETSERRFCKQESKDVSKMPIVLRDQTRFCLTEPLSLSLSLSLTHAHTQTHTHTHTHKHTRNVASIGTPVPVSHSRLCDTGSEHVSLCSYR